MSEIIVLVFVFNCPLKIQYIVRSSHRRCFIKKIFLKIPQYSHKKTPSGLQFYYKETPTQAFSCNNCKIFKYTYSDEHLLTGAPVSRFFSADNLVMISKFTAFTKEKLPIRTVSICCKIHRQCIVI